MVEQLGRLVTRSEAHSDFSRIAAMESNRTDPNCARGEHWIVAEGHSAMSMAERGAEATGIPKKGISKIAVLHDKTAKKIYYSLTDHPMSQKMFELGMFGSVRTAQNNIKRLKDYASEVKREIELVPGTHGGSDRGACGRDMPANLDLWLSVASEVPVGDNVTKLEKQAKRKRAEHEEK